MKILRTKQSSATVATPSKAEVEDVMLGITVLHMVEAAPDFVLIVEILLQDPRNELLSGVDRFERHRVYVWVL